MKLSKPLLATFLLPIAAIAAQAQVPNVLWSNLAAPALRLDVSKNNTFVVAQFASSARVYSVATGTVAAAVQTLGTFNDISISADGEVFAVSTSGAGNNVCRVFSTQTGNLVATLPAAGTGGIFVGEFSPNLTGTQRLAIGNATTNRRIRVYSQDGGGNWDWNNFADYGDDLDLQPVGIGWNPSGSRFVAAFNTTAFPRSAIFQISSPGAPIISHDPPSPNLGMSNFSTVAMAPDESTIVITGSTGFAIYSGTGSNQIGLTTTGLSSVRDARYLNNSSGFLLRVSEQVRTYNNTGALTFTYSPTAIQYLSNITIDDQFYASGTNGNLFGYSVGFTNPQTVVQNSPNLFPSGSRVVAFSPDGSRMVSAPHTVTNQVYIFNTALGTIATTISLPNSEDRGHDFAYSPDGTVLYIYTRASTGPTGVSRVTRWDANTGTSAGSPFLATSSGAEISQINGGISLSPDGSLLAFLNGNNRIVTIFTTSDGNTFAESSQLPGTSVTNIRFTPDGSNLIFCTRGTGNDAIHRMPLTASSLTVAESSNIPTGTAGFVAVAPNGEFAVVRAQTQLVRYSLPNISATPTVLGPNLSASSNTTFVDISPDSTMVTTGSSDDGVIIRSTATGATIAQLLGIVQVVQPVRFSPDGNHLGFMNTSGESFYASLSGISGIGGTIFWEGPNSGPLPRLMVGWRTLNGTVVLPTVVIDVAPTDWQVRTVGPLVPGDTDSLIWQNTNPNFSIPGLIAIWNLASDGTPSPGGTGGAPPSIEWQVRAFRDLNSDGFSDLLWVNSATGQVVIWYIDSNGDVSGTVAVGVVPSGWSLVTAGTENRLFFQNNTTTQVAYWTIDNTGAVTSTTTVGFPGANWSLQGFGAFDNGNPALLFRNTSSNLLAYWDVDAAGAVTGTGTLGEAPAGWSIIGVGRL